MPAATTAAQRALVGTTTAFLFVAPAAASAGLRATALLAAALCLAITWRTEVAPRWRSAPRAVTLAYLAWIALAVASVAWSAQPEYTLGELRAQALYGTLAFVTFFLVASDTARWRLWTAALAAGTLVVFALQHLQSILPFPISRHPMDGGGGPMSTHLVLLAPVLLALAWPRPWGWNRHAGVLALALLLLLAAAWDSGNRIVWGAFAVQLVVVLVLWRHMPAMDPRRERIVRAVVAAAGVALAIAFAGAIVERNERLYDPALPVTTHLERDLRPRIWATAVEQIRKAPWLGHGFGREILAPVFVPLTPDALHPEVRHGHNLFLDQALQLGLVGAAAFTLLFALLALEYARMLRVRELAPYGVVGLAILAGFVTKSLTDDFLHRHNAAVFWALNGMLLGLARPRSRE